jgi:D-arabinose 1-dehydrogenase-like Zn-dependent alcohol dehydrogenase
MGLSLCAPMAGTPRERTGGFLRRKQQACVGFRPDLHGAMVCEPATVIVARPTTGEEVKLNLRLLYGWQRTIPGSFMGGRGESLDALKFIGRGKLTVVIDSSFPLQDAAAAQKKMESRDFFGKIVLHL